MKREEGHLHAAGDELQGLAGREARKFTRERESDVRHTEEELRILQSDDKASAVQPTPATHHASD